MAKNEKPHNAIYDNNSCLATHYVIYDCLNINTLGYSECPFFKERNRYEKEKDP